MLFLVTSCGSSSSTNRTKNQSSGRQVSSSADMQGINTENHLSNLAEDEEDEEEDRQAVRPVVIAGSYFDCVVEGEDSLILNGLVPTNCTISAEGLSHSKVVGNHVYARVGPLILKAPPGVFKGDAYEFSLEVEAKIVKYIDQIELFVLDSDTNAIDRISDL